MIDIKINGESLELGKGLQMELTIHSPLFDPEVIKGVVSLPINISARSEVNRRILGYPDLLQSAADRRKVFDCELYDDSIFILKGKLKLSSSTKETYPCYILSDAAGFGQDLQEVKLKDLDLGTVTMPVSQLTSDMYFVEVPDKDYDRSGVPSDGLLSKTLFVFNYNGNRATAEFDTSIDETLKKLEGKIQNNDAAFPLVARASGGRTLCILPDDPGDYVYTFSIANVTFTATTATEEVVFTKNLERFVYENVDISLLNNSVHHTADSGYYVLPETFNEDFYGTENSYYAKYVNRYTTLGYAKNTVYYPTRNTLVPHIFFKTVLIKCFEKAGWGVEGDLLNDPDLAYLILYSTKSLDRQAPGINIPFNIYRSSFALADQLPDWSVAEFLNAVRSLLCLGYFFDMGRKVCTIRYMKGVVNAPCRKDYSLKVAPGHSDKSEELKLYQLLFRLDSSDLLAKADEQTKLLPEVYSPYGTGKEKIEVDISGIMTVVKKYRLTFLVEANRTYPTAKQPGISPLFGLQNNSFAPRLLFWKGLQTDAAGSYPMGSNAQAGYELKWNGAKGLYENFWKDYLNFKQQTREVEMSVSLDIVDLKNFRLDEKLYINGLNFLPAKLSLTLPISKPARISLLKA